MLLTTLLVNPWSVCRLLPDRTLEPGAVFLLGSIDICVLLVAFIFLFLKQKVAIFRGFLLISSISAWTLLFVAGCELYLALRQAAPGAGADPYGNFTVQHLHPFYFFSVSSEPKLLAEINNATVSVGHEGFRGSPPEEKGDRKLAFLLGGSAAFGFGASSNQTTISGYLNDLQQEYHFVNAGVASWNSTQEFYRVAMQLLRYKPALIVVYDGANDADIDLQYLQDGKPYPPGTTASYDELSRWVDDIRAEPERSLLEINPSRLYDITLPRTTSRFARFLHIPRVGTKRGELDQPVSAAAADRGAAMYLWTIENMQRLANSRGTRLEIFWQAMSTLHRAAKMSDQVRENEDVAEYLQRFRLYVHEHREEGLRFYDLGNVFDAYSGTVALNDVFIDPVHLNDRGNRIVAGEIWSRISPPAKR